MTFVCPKCRRAYDIPVAGRYSCRDCGPTTILVAAPVPPTPPPKPATPPPVAKPTPPPVAAAPPQSPPKPATLPLVTPTSSPGAAAPTTQPPTPGATGAPPDAPAELPAAAQKKAAELEAAIRAQPNARASYLQLAQLYADHGQSKRGAEILKGYLVLDPQNAFVKSRVQALEGRGVAQRPILIGAGKSSTTTGAATPTRRAQTKPDRRIQAGVAVLALVLIALALRPFLFPSARPVVVESWSAVSPRWSPRGDRIAFLAHRPNGSKWCTFDVASGAVRELAELEASGEPVWAPDGEQLAFVGDSDEDGVWAEAVFVVRASGGAPRRIAYGESPSWSGDSTRLALLCRTADPKLHAEAFHEETPQVCVANVITGEVRKLASRSGTDPAFAPAGDRIVYVVREEPASEAMAEDGEPYSPPGDDHDPASLAESALSGGASNIMEADRGLSREMEARDSAARARPRGGDWPRAKTYLWEANARSGQVRQLTFDGNAEAPRWTARGERILYLVDGSDGFELWWMNPDGSDKTPLGGDDVSILDPETAVVTGDLRHLIARGTVHANEGVAMLMAGAAPADLYDIDIRSRRARRLENKHSFKQAFSLSPDGDDIAYEYTNSKTNTRELWLLER